MEFHGDSKGRTSLCMHHKPQPLASGGRTCPGFGIDIQNTLPVETTICEEWQLITAFVPAITIDLVAFNVPRTLSCFILSQGFIFCQTSRKHRDDKCVHL